MAPIKDPKESSLTRPLLLALSVHLLGLIWVALRPAPSHVLPITSPGALEIDVVHSHSTSTNESSAPGKKPEDAANDGSESTHLEPRLLPRTHSVITTKTSRTQEINKAPVTALEGEPNHAVAVTSGANSEGHTSQATQKGTRDIRPKIDLGLDGGLAQLLRGQSPRVLSANEKSVNNDIGGLRKALAQHDVKNGMGRAGFVASLGRSVTLEIGPAQESTATFRVSFDRRGKVASVGLLNATSKEEQWSSVGAALDRALLKKRLPLPSDANGYLVVVKMRTLVRLPDGSPSNGSNRLRRRGLSLELKLPDPVNIGQSARRTASAWIVNEEAL